MIVSKQAKTALPNDIQKASFNIDGAHKLYLYWTSVSVLFCKIKIWNTFKAKYSNTLYSFLLILEHVLRICVHFEAMNS